MEWSTLESIANTKAIDMWLLFPIGVGVNRLLTRDKPPSGRFADALTRIFGTDKWKEAFYGKDNQTYLINLEIKEKKYASFNKIEKFFIYRLKTIFTAVAENPLTLKNSKNVPLYLLCFAAGNPKGAKTAVKIAQSILKS